MNKKQLLGIVFFIFIVLISSNSLALTNEESSVGRIVGESPAELLSQLEENDFDIDEVTYFDDGPNAGTYYNKELKALKKQFDSNNVEYESTFTWNEVESEIENLDNNELFILTANAGDSYQEIKRDGDFTLNVNEIDGWLDPFKSKKPLFLFDAPYSGAYMPKDNTFVNRLTSATTIIAPSSFGSPYFIRSFVCNMEDGKNMGDIFRDARNFHYQWGSKSNKYNYPGLVLQSYTLYGSPFDEIDMPYYDSDTIKKYCNNYYKNLDTNIDYLGQVGNNSKFRKHLSYEVNDINLLNVGNYSFINITGSFQRLESEDLVLPVSVRTTKFPSGTIFSNISINYVGDPFSITVSDLPTYLFGYVERMCYENSTNYSVDFSDYYDGPNHNLVATIVPVSVDDCQTGQVTVYRQFNYSVDYITPSPALIDKITIPKSIRIDESLDVQINLMKLQTNNVSGLIKIFDSENQLVVETELNISTLYYNVSFLPVSGGEFSVELIFENETTHMKTFSLVVNSVNIQADIPVTVPSNPTIPILIESYSNQSFNSEMDYYLTLNGIILDSGTLNVSLLPGNTTIPLQFYGLTRENQSYNLKIDLNYNGDINTEEFLLNTNNLPIIFLDYPRTILENETMVIDEFSFDPDNDSFSLIMNDSRFVLQNNTYSWHTNYNNSGIHAVKFTIYDDLINTSTIAFFEVKNVVRPAVFEGIITFFNGTSVNNGSIIAVINDSIVSFCNVSNGTYNISLLYNSNEEFRNGGEEWDEIDFYYENFSTTPTAIWHNETITYLNLTVYDINQYPVATFDPFNGSMILENETVNLTVNAYDPEGQNLSYSWFVNNTLLNFTGKILPFSVEEWGKYNVTVVISDGDLSINHSWIFRVIKSNMIIWFADGSFEKELYFNESLVQNFSILIPYPSIIEKAEVTLK